MLFSEFNYRINPLGRLREVMLSIAVSKFHWRDEEVDDPSSYKFSYFNHDRYCEPNDNELALSVAIDQHVIRSDVVLSTVNYLASFRSMTDAVSGYDIAPVALQHFATRGEDPSKLWWCDIFDEKMMAYTLNVVKPSVLYVSNIPDWRRDMADLELLVRQCRNQNVAKLIWAKHSNCEKSPATELASLIANQGFGVQRFDEWQGRHKNRPVFVATLI